MPVCPFLACRYAVKDLNVKSVKAGFWVKKKKKACLSRNAKEVDLVIFDPPRAKSTCDPASDKAADLER